MILSEEDKAVIVSIIEADTDNFAELAKISGLNPASHYRHANLRNVDFANSDLTGFNFTGADLRGCTGLPSPEKAAEIGLILTDAILE